MNRPERMEIAWDNIPPELKDRKQWCVWRWEAKDGRWTKPPYQACGVHASSDKPETWSTFQAVRMRLKAGGYDGVGFVISKDDPYVGIDFDDSRDPATGLPKQWAKTLIDSLASYTETSPSGHGFKTLVKAKLPGPGHHGEELGLFDHGRYFCITGNLLNGSKEIHDRQEVINQIIRQRWPGDFAPKETPPSSSSNGLLEEEILKRAFRDSKFTRLWNGDISGYPSQSEADSALVMKLLFFTAKDPQRTDALFRQSGLYREKWERQDYRERTIERALSVVKESYRPISQIKTLQPVTANNFPRDTIGGLAGEFADLFSTYLESPWSFFAFGFLTCLGNLISDRITLASEITPQPRLFTVNLGESADDRKSESIKKTIRFFEDTLARGSFPVCHGIGSAEGLARILGDNLENSKKLTLIYDELKAFVSKATIEGATLLPAVNSFFEGNRFQSATKTHSIDLDNVYLSLLAASTLETFSRMWTPAFLDIGFLNRLWLVRDRGERRFSIPREIPQGEITALQKKLGELLRGLPQNYIKLPITEEARAIFDEWYFSLDPGPFSKRLDTYGLRLMIILAANESQTSITEEIARAVVTLLRWQLEVRRECDPVDAENNIAKMEEMIRRTLARGPMEQRLLQRMVHYNRYGLFAWRNAIDNLCRSREVFLDNKTKTYSLAI